MRAHLFDRCARQFASYLPFLMSGKETTIDKYDYIEIQRQKQPLSEMGTCVTAKKQTEKTRALVCALLLPSFMNAEYNKFEQSKIQEL